MAASVLPFLAALRKGIVPDLSTMTSDDPSFSDNLSAPSVIKAMQQPQVGPPSPDGTPPAPPPQAPQPQGPDMTLGAPPQPPPPDPTQSLIKGMAAGDQKPTLAPETKAHKLMRVLLGAAYGGLMGQAANAQSYAQTGRNAGFGGGVAGALEMPLQLQHQQLQNEQVRQMLPFLRASQIAGLQKTSSEAQKNLAEANKAQGETAGLPIKQALEQAQTEAANYKEDPNMGLVDLRTGKPVSNTAAAPLTAEEAQILGKQPGERVPIKLKNQANEIAVRGLTTVNTEEGVYERNRQTGGMTRLGSNPRMMFAPDQRIIQVGDPDNPGQTKFVKAGDAVAQGLPGTQSASVAVPKNVLKWATTGEGGKQAGAFNTAMQHADLLEQAVTALGNGDTRTLNSIKNAFSKEFGSSDITNFQVISNAYSREITKMLASGHMTDSEVGSAEATLPANASPEQLLGAIHAYKALAGSKMVILHDQFTKGMQSQPNFPANPTGGGPPAGASHAVVVNGKVVGYTSDGKTMTPAP